MVTRQSFGQKVPGLLFLLGALMFSLSSLPGHNEKATEMSSSQDSCDYVRGLHRSSDGVTCNSTKTTNGKVVNGTVTAKLVTDSYNDALDNNKLVTNKYIQIDVDLETECKEGCAEGKRTESIQHQAALSDLGKLNDIVKTLVENGSAELAKTETQAEATAAEEAKKKKAETEKLNKCDDDGKGHKYTTAKSQLDCMAKRIDKMDDNHADEYYAKYIEPKLEKLSNCDTRSGAARTLPLPRGNQQPLQQQAFSSTCATTQRQVMQFMQDLDDSGVGDDVLSDSLKDLYYEQMTKAAAMQNLQKLNSLPANSPFRQQMMAQLQSEKSNADWYFYDRGQQVSNYAWPDSWGWDPANTMGTMLQGQRNSVDQSFGNIYNGPNQGGFVPANGTAFNGTHPQTLPMPGAGGVAPGINPAIYNGNSSPFLSNSNPYGFQPQVINQMATPVAINRSAARR